MGKKAEEKRLHIIKSAEQVFARKGYASVTMKDIVEECGISRGGLYIYFSSVEEVFEAVIEYESHETDQQRGDKLPKDAGATDILMFFLKAQKEDILKKNKGLVMAEYEYAYSKRKEGKENPMKKRFDMEVKVVEKIIETGIESKEFVCVYPKLEAQNIMSTIEGLKVLSETAGITEAFVDESLAYILGRITVD